MFIVILLLFNFLPMVISFPFRSHSIAALLPFHYHYIAIRLQFYYHFFFHFTVYLLKSYCHFIFFPWSGHSITIPMTFNLQFISISLPFCCHFLPFNAIILSFLFHFIAFSLLFQSISFYSISHTQINPHSFLFSCHLRLLFCLFVIFFSDRFYFFSCFFSIPFIFFPSSFLVFFSFRKQKKPVSYKCPCPKFFSNFSVFAVLAMALAVFGLTIDTFLSSPTFPSSDHIFFRVFYY